MNTPRPDHLEQRLRRDAERIAVSADEHFSQRVSNQLNPPHVSTRPPVNRLSWWAWGIAAPAALAVAVLLLQNPAVQPGPQPAALAGLDVNLDKALAQREHDLRRELQKVRSDLNRVESMLGLGGKAFSK